MSAKSGALLFAFYFPMLLLPSVRKHVVVMSFTHFSRERGTAGTSESLGLVEPSFDRVL